MNSTTVDYVLSVPSASVADCMDVHLCALNTKLMAFMSSILSHLTIPRMGYLYEFPFNNCKNNVHSPMKRSW